MRAKFVFENVSFIRGGDAKSSLGIGGYSFDTLRNGTIVRCIKSFGHSLGGVLRSYNGSARKIAVGSYLVIYNIKKIDQYYISFNYVNAGGASWLLRDDDKIKRGLEYLERARDIKKIYLADRVVFNDRGYYVGTIAKIGKNKFNNLLKIIEPPNES